MSTPLERELEELEIFPLQFIKTDEREGNDAVYKVSTAMGSFMIKYNFARDSKHMPAGYWEVWSEYALDSVRPVWTRTWLGEVKELLTKLHKINVRSFIPHKFAN